MTELRPPRPPAWARTHDAPECPPGSRIGPPDFIGVGVQRAGTSWWSAAIQAHPRVFRPEGRAKELHYFNRFWEGDAPADLAERYHALFPRPEATISGEWTPSYMHHFWIAPLLARAAPDARILVALRDPVERYLSGLSRAARRAEKEGRQLRMAQLSDALQRGLYHKQLERLLEHFPREQVLVLQYERCRQDPEGQLAATYRFLGLETLEQAPEALAVQSRPQRWKPALSAGARAEIVARLSEDVARTAALCPEIELSLWPNFAQLAPQRDPVGAGGREAGA